MADIKTIQINPALFQSTGKKTRKIREKKNIIISTNTLRAKLLKRVSEHKKNEKNGKNKSEQREKTMHSEIDKSIEFLNNLKPTVIAPTPDKKIIQINIVEPIVANGDFIDSVNYLNTLQNNHIPQVNLGDFPVELPDCSTKYNVDNDVPYGVLKNGKKPTYRNWKQTRKVFEDISLSPTIQIASQSITPSVSSCTSSSTYITPSITPIQLVTNQTTCASNDLSLGALIDASEELSPIKISNTNGIKKITKTIRVQHKLGKMNNKIGVLIKNNATRKNILNAQTEIKKTPIADITSYLRKHGLIKVGSVAPNDVIRKTFESAMLSGEVTNNNDEILLENFMNDI